MKNLTSFEYPDQLQKELRKAKKLEWITLVYLISVVVLMYLVMGSSQAMKTAWLEDALSTLPAISFLIAYRFYNKKPNKDFPYGYHRIYGIAFLTGSLALFLMGSYLLIDSSMALIKAEKPSIGSIFILGHQVWMGWMMIGVLLYSSLPAMWLGYRKLPLAKKLHNKILFTDAQAQKADWTTGFAAILGILGVGLGFWWADALAAVIISFSVLKDGFSNLKDAVLELMDRHPVTLEDKTKDDLVNEVAQLVNTWDWVEKAGVRFREHGMVYFGEIYIIPHQSKKTDFEKARNQLKNYHWKIHEVTLMEVREIPDYLVTAPNGGSRRNN
ncbi:cation diffusion facilitator family transporter [Membranicola marinus]|uniref:Cation diffusion facilitator family transporter n=1 Tax=Membranihabitans marinus TaxID=1227546 RepID=A0A953I0M1_9BACT|nr:cation diffusion facilitator family transporter [Membranihabitans marinus]MBY5959087.1 cation diffusion facilitator family transporter [Membranihabitans marinus]